MNLTEKSIIPVAVCGSYEVIMDDKYRICIPSAIRRTCLNNEEETTYFFIENNEERIEIYFPYLIKDEIKEYLQENKSNQKRINYFKDKYIEVLDSQNRIKLKLEDRIKNLKSNESWKVTLIGNGDHLFINLKDIKFVEK